MTFLTPAWTPLKPHPVQSAAWRTKARFVGIYAGRGSGKTEIARRYLVRHLNVRKPWPDPQYFYALPTYMQAKRVAWKKIKALIPPHWIANLSESELWIETIFGSTLHVVGLDRPERIEGLQYDGGIVDESSDQKPGVFDLSIAPAMTHRDPFCWRIGVPKRFGRGATEFKRFCLETAQATYTWPSSSVLEPEQLEYFKRTLSIQDFDEQFNASWLKASGAIYHGWSSENISSEVQYCRDQVIWVGQDFNVNPMCWCLAHIVGDSLHIFDQLFERNTNTQACLDKLHARYGSHEGGWVFCGDASAGARKTSAAASDLAQIRNDRRFTRKRVLFFKKNPPVIDRFASCNALMCNALGERRLLVHPRCKTVISDAENRNWKPDTREPDDGPDEGHMADAFGYIIYRLWPLRVVGGSSVLVSTGYNDE